MNVLLIDNNVRNYEIFNSAANANTIPIVYSSSTSTTEDILSAIRQSISSQSQTIARIGLVFEIKEPREPTLFLDNAPFFQETDTAGATAYSANVDFLINLITEFQVAHIDFLACNSLNQPAWVNYYALLTTATGVIVGASSDNTGNIYYGGDWIMESTSQDIQLIYFTTDIENYASLLDGPAYGSHSIVILADRNVYGTGDNDYGQLGLNNNTANFNTLQYMIPVGKRPIYITGGQFFTLVLMSDGTVYGTGDNRYGQLGIGLGPFNTLQLMPIPDGKIAKYIACGQFFSLVLMTDGTIYGAGFNKWGQLGIGNNNDSYNSLQPMIMISGKTPNYIFAGYQYSIILMTDGTVYGTGRSPHGQLGLGNNLTKFTLQSMPLPTGKLAKYVGVASDHTIIVMTDGTVYGTGYNYYGQLGLGNYTTPQYSLQSITLPGVGLAQNVACNGYFTIILMIDGTIYGTGLNNVGQLGVGTYNASYNILTPMDMSIIAGKTVKSIACGDTHTLVITTDKTVYGTGNNVGGQLGLGNYTGNFSTLQLCFNGAQVIGPFSLLDLYNMPCFNADTKILTKKGYRPVQELRKGDLIKTLRDGYKPIALIGKRDIYHDARANANNKTDVEEKKNSLYRCSQENYPDLFEELLITGAHAILVDELTDLERENTIEVLTKIYVTDGKYRLPACVDERATMYEKSGTYTIFHMALEHENNVMNYGIYANGLLVETCSQRYLKEYSGMTLL